MLHTITSNIIFFCSFVWLHQLLFYQKTLPRNICVCARVCECVCMRMCVCAHHIHAAPEATAPYYPFHIRVCLCFLAHALTPKCVSSKEKQWCVFPFCFHTPPPLPPTLSPCHYVLFLCLYFYPYTPSLSLPFCSHVILLPSLHIAQTDRILLHAAQVELWPRRIFWEFRESWE